jgi:hypothetical protein
LTRRFFDWFDEATVGIKELFHARLVTKLNDSLFGQTRFVLTRCRQQEPGCGKLAKPAMASQSLPSKTSYAPPGHGIRYSKVHLIYFPLTFAFNVQ